jgi:hypothetical protein
MSTQTFSSLPSSNCFLDCLEGLLKFKNVWVETAEAADLTGLDLRCVALAVESTQLERVLEVLARCPVPINPEIYQDAAITHLYADGRSECLPIVQIEFIVRVEQIVAVLERLSAAELIGKTKDRMVIVRNLSSALTSDCQIFPAGARAPYSHFVRWRRFPRNPAAAAQAAEACFQTDNDAEFSTIVPVC